MPVFLNREENTEKQYYVTDSHGNVVQLTDANGKVAKIYEYDSFGNEMKPDEKDDNPFRYCGEYYDKETEEIYLRARYYQPVLGRFLTRDSYTGEDNDPLTLHLYTYCEGDGINQIDPSGHWGKNIHFGLTKVIAKALGFSKQDAYLIAKGCIGADKWTKKSGKWKLIIKNIPVSGRKKKEKIIIKESDISNSLKMYKSRGTGKDFHGFKPDLHTVNKNFYKAIKMGEKIALSVGMKNTKKRMKKMALIGLWLHARQDRYAHGLKKEKIKHVGKTDNIKYDYE